MIGLRRLRRPRSRWRHARRCVSRAIAGSRNTVHVVAATRGKRCASQRGDEQESWIFHFSFSTVN
ncbi:hypothetical protein BSLA_03r0234 [Burkholderia stabilis]|nr:hypothetical protein BSLA_03r0234 [Burkholderia stabilis]